MATDRTLISSIRSRLEDRDTKALIGIWRKNDRAEWSDETFQAIRGILADRKVAVPMQEEAASPDPDQLLLQPGRAPSSTLGAIWRGEVPLARMFWLYFVLVVIVADVAQPMLSKFDEMIPTIISALIGVAYLVYLPVCLIGVIRSTGRYQGKRIWSLLARMVAGLGLIAFIVGIILVVMDFNSIIRR